MSEPTPEVEAAQPDDQPTEADATDWKAEARKWEERAKENRKAAAELERQRQASMTEAEKAVAEAESRGRQTAAQEFAQRLARSDFLTAAARRNPTYDAAAILDDLNLSRYVGEDGEPDTKAIAKAVERLIPVGSSEPERPTSLDLGAKRTLPSGPNMNDLIRKAAGRA